MKRHLLKGGGLAGIGLAALLAYFIAVAASPHHPAWLRWLPWLIIVITAAGIASYFLGQPRRNRVDRAAPDQDAAEVPATDSLAAPPGEAITDRWRNTNDGFQVPRMMRIRDHSISHPGYGHDYSPPSVRTALLIACSPLGPTPATSDIRAKFLAFLGQQSISSVVTALTTVPDSFTWTAWDDRPRRNFTAILNGNDQQTAPIAWARLLLPEAGVSYIMQDPRSAELVLHVYPRTPDGIPAPAEGLPAWYDRLARITRDLPSALARFLADDLGLTTTDQPYPQLGIFLDTPHSITELVDPQHLKPLPGTTPVNWFMAWGIADPAGQSAAALVYDWLTQMCDNTLRVNDYEDALEDIRDAFPASATQHNQVEVLRKLITTGRAMQAVLQASQPLSGVIQLSSVRSRGLG